MIRFTPVGRPRDLALATLRQVTQAVADGDTTLAAPRHPADQAPGQYL